MAVARVTEVICSSKKSFQKAIEKGIKRSCKSLDNVSGAWVKEQKVVVKKKKIKQYRVTLMITFVLND